MPPGFEHRDGHRIAEIEAALAGPQREAHALSRRELRAHRVRQAGGLRAEDQVVARLPCDIGKAPLAARREGEHSLDARVLIANEIVPRRMALQIRVLVIVEPRALELLVVHGKAERLDQVQPRTGVGAQPDHIAGVGRNLRVDEHDVEHGGGILRRALTVSAPPTTRSHFRRPRS